MGCMRLGWLLERRERAGRLLPGVLLLLRWLWGRQSPEAGLLPFRHLPVVAQHEWRCVLGLRERHRRLPALQPGLQEVEALCQGCLWPLWGCCNALNLRQGRRIPGCPRPEAFEGAPVPVRSGRAVRAAATDIQLGDLKVHMVAAALCAERLLRSDIAC